jgi:CRP-like cAMP-binding protein
LFHEQEASPIARSPLFQGLPPAQCDSILASASHSRFDAKQRLFREGELGRFVGIIASGKVKVTLLSVCGEEVILNVKVPGDMIDGLTVPPGSTHHVTVQSLEPCSVLLWDFVVFQSYLEHIPMLQRNMTRILAERLRSLEERFLELATEQVAPRLARTLVRLVQQTPQPTLGSLHIGLSREELAQMIGTTLFTVSRLLSDWEARGVVLAKRKAILVQDIKSLRTIAELS